MNSEKIGSYHFEILPHSSVSPFITANPTKSATQPYYVSIRSNLGTPLASTLLTHHFATEDAAHQFCQDVAEGKYSIKQLIAEEQKAFDIWKENSEKIAEQQFTYFMLKTQELGITPEQITKLFEAYDQLPPRSRDFIRNPEYIASFLLEHPMPAKQENTFGTWFNQICQDVDVCLVDCETGEHLMDALCYLDPEELASGDYEYTPMEQWLLSLPLDHIVKEAEGCYLAVVNTEFNLAQTDFLLGNRPEIISSDPETLELNNMYIRAELAGAEFSERLAYLSGGASFEHPFDGSCMDVQDASDRSALCQMLRKGNAFVCPGFEDEAPYAYRFSVDAKGRIYCADEFISLQTTAPGKGLFSTIEGRILQAELSKANQSMQNISHSSLSR